MDTKTNILRLEELENLINKSEKDIKEILREYKFAVETVSYKKDDCKEIENGTDIWFFKNEIDATNDLMAVAGDNMHTKTGRILYIYENNKNAECILDYYVPQKEMNFKIYNKLKPEEEKQDIKHSIEFDLEQAYRNKSEAMYWLERLPTSGDHDETVNDFRNELYSCIRHHDLASYDITTNELIEYYQANIENYDF